ncbi:AraC family transcriptional regulator [Alcanivorax sp. 1008]|uniref:AraC family transcriptional regulator n=1 Tax=Alcanivorax sp. 1008 TaxID=2816853 RepID=UPI001DCD95F1|nr:AraC family transcriptional regulator [Alcanivorax sp. 1008]MCC1495333.1 AraC family transcriptional regulator ligand-binding domain-containing protein [Alcanivorax sp. 1008]
MSQLPRADSAVLTSIPASYTRLIAQELGMHARDLPDLLSETDLTVEQLLDEATRLSTKQQIQVIENALRLSQDEGFGLRLGKRLTPPAHGPMGFLASSSPNLLAAVEAIQAFLPTRVSFVQLSLNQNDDKLVISCTFDVEMRPEVSRFMAEICAMVFFSCAEFIIGRPAVEVETHFAHADPGASAGYAEHIPGSVSFSNDDIVVRVPMHLCRIPNVSANHESYALARKQCEAALANLRGAQHSYRRQIETMMLSHPTGTLTEEDAAAALFVSKRTLARRLKKEGVGFRQIRDDLLARQAKSYLRDGQLSVDAIATLLNYHDSANFRRAFKRWCGMPPDQYRIAGDLTLE